MIVLGDPQWQRDDGEACELRFLVDGAEVAVVHGDEDIRMKWKVQRRAIGANTIIVALSGTVNSGLGLLPNNGHIALWIRLSEREALQCMGTGQIDYFSREIENGTCAVEIHARSTMAQLIDRPWNTSFAGHLADLLRQAGDGAVKMDVRGLTSRRVRSYIDSTSAFAALRLLGISHGFIIEEDYEKDGISCKSIKIAKEEWSSKIPSVINEADIISLSEKRGRPIKNRDE